MISRCAVLLALSLPLLAAPPKLRLPETSRPIEYEVGLRLDPAQEQYTGIVVVDIEILKPTSEIWLNAEGLNIQNGFVKAGSRTIEAKVLPQPKDFVGYALGETLQPGRVRLRTAFTGKFDSRNSNGLFRMQEAGDWYAYTQFEPIAARAAFPCYDEPGYKVPWTLGLQIPRALKAAANTPLVSETEDREGMKTLAFAKSQPMPSYLVAFAVGPFEFVDAGKAGSRQTPLRIITPKGKAAEARYAIEITGKVLEEIERYFGIPYPYEKLDSIAIPLTFGFGAMENAGLITYARTLLLSPPGRESDSFRQGYLSVAAHEIAHQWFGNLVTPEYWDDIWLNEAFATWLEAKITHQMRPEWKRNVSEVEGKTYAMGEDSLISSRRIRQPIESNGDIVNAFDGITYTKGAAVIGMFENYLGEAAFQAGVRQYMQRYRWRNATSGMFLDSISAPQGKNVSAAFSTFLNQAGVPLLTASLKCSGQPAIEFKQERLLPVGSKGSTAQSWQLPVCIGYDGQPGASPECHMLTAPIGEVALKGKSCPAWFNANAGGHGYYRVLYPAGMMNKLADSGRLTAAETVDLLGNAVALANAGKLPAADLVALARRFAADPEWRIASRASLLLQKLEDFVDAATRPAYARLVQELFGPRARALGWKTQQDPERSREQQALLPFVALAGEDRALRAEALDLGRRWLKDRSSLSPDLAGSVLEVAARTGGTAFFSEVKAALPATTDRRERRLLVSALGRSGDAALARQAMTMLTGKEIEFREGTPILFGALSTSSTRPVAYEFVRENFDGIMAVAPAGGSFNFGTVLPGVANGLCSVEKAAEARAFFGAKLKDVVGVERTIATMVEANELCVALRTAMQPQIPAALKQ